MRKKTINRIHGYPRDRCSSRGRMACLSTAISSPITKVERERESVDDEDDRNEDDDGDDDNHDDGDDDDDDDDDDSDDDAEGVKKIMMMTPIC